MILGILSDTHGQYERAARAIALLKDAGAEAFVHCGDVGGDDVFARFAGERLWFVWGNCDHPSRSELAYVRSLGLTPPEEVPLPIELEGRRIAVFHGHEPELDRFQPAGFDYLLHGHTHVRRDERVDGVRIINPGALHRAREYSVATLDLAADVLAFHVV
jgi:hypothetical protein